MSTENCKNFLTKHFGLQEWKRISKKKDVQKNEIRVFENKATQEQVVIIESPSGVLSFGTLDPSTVSTHKNYNKELIEAFYKFSKTRELPKGDEPWFSQIPSIFEYSFQDGLCCDHEGVLEDIQDSEDLNTVVTGLGIVIWPKRELRNNMIHVGTFIQPFLSDILEEVEECIFAIHAQYMSTYDDERLQKIANGTIPSVTVNDIFNELDSKGFIYDKRHCSFGSIKKKKINRQYN